MEKTLGLVSRLRLYLGLLWKIAIIMVGGVGILLNLENAGGFMNGSYLFYYFTILSNLVMMASAILFIVIDVVSLERGQETKLTFFRLFRLASAVAVALTMTVFFAFLLPSSGPGYAESPANLTVHLILPLLGMLDFVVFEGAKTRLLQALAGMAFPLLYLVFVYAVAGPLGLAFDPSGAKVPYFFLDYRKLGWFDLGSGNLDFGVFYWILILLAIVLAISVLLVALQKLLHQKKKRSA